MARVTVAPDEFTMVDFDPERIRDLAAELADQVGLPADFPVHIEVDQASPLGNIGLDFDGSAVVLNVQSGAFENAKSPRTLSEDGTRLVLARLFFRIRDRLDDAFGDPPADADLTFEQYTAWDAYALGRFERLGFDAEQPRRRYHFRLRHGFSDVADQVFERLWGSDGLSWADIDAACAETAAAREAAA